MEFMVAWYPAVKLTATLVGLAGIYFLYTHKHMKTLYTLGSLWLIVIYLAPVKIDGTESHRAYRLEQAKANSYHKNHSSSAQNFKIIHVKKLSFNEQMALEDARSEKANRVIAKDIAGK